jgi:predicted RND superfamily exporter protein
MGQMEHYLVVSQRRAFGVAFLLVMGFIALLFRSARAGLLSAVPNLLPLLVTLGVMGWTGIRLDATTVMIAPLLLGIVVDDTVHVLERVLRGRREGRSVPAAFEASVGEVGHAVVLTTVILACGFLTPLLGSFKPNFFFAVLAALALVLALVADLVVFPAVASLAPWLVAGDRGRSP